MPECSAERSPERGNNRSYDTVVIGGGPAGLAAALSAHEAGASTLLIEREARLGGILKQCIHDGFGLVRFGEKLTGPEYAERFLARVQEAAIDTLTLTFVTRIEKEENEPGFAVTVVNRNGIETIRTKTLVLATGCRERTARQVSIHGTRPAGVYTAGAAQHFTNLLGQLPTRRCVILGSGAISHHHGIGKMFAPWLEGYLGEKEYGAVKVLKHYFDPDGVMNPGGTLGLDLPPEEKKFLNTRKDYR